MLLLKCPKWKPNKSQFWLNCFFFLKPTFKAFRVSCNQYRSIEKKHRSTHFHKSQFEQIYSFFVNHPKQDPTTQPFHSCGHFTAHENSSSSLSIYHPLNNPFRARKREREKRTSSRWSDHKHDFCPASRVTALLTHHPPSSSFFTLSLHHPDKRMKRVTCLMDALRRSRNNGATLGAFDSGRRKKMT